MTRLVISSSSNRRLKALRRLARRGSSDVLVAEGSRALRSALAAGVPVREVYAAPELYLGELDAPLVQRAERAGACVVEMSSAVFRTIAGNGRPDGLLALVERPATSLDRLELPPAPFLVVAVAIERPGNLGAIARTAAAVGADALVIADPCTDVFQREVVRGSVGAIFHLPAGAGSSADVIAWLRRRRIRVVATSPGGAMPYWGARFDGAVAVALGGERRGLDTRWLDAAAETVAIPMHGPVDSLNVGVATGVVLCEAARRRASA